MEYTLLIYVDPSTYATMSEADMGKMMADYGTFTEGLGARFKAGAPLQPVATASSVRVRDGKRLTTDGPFAETKEHLVGFYHVDAADLDEALDLAAGIPDSVRGTIEVRPVMDLPGM